MQPFLPRPLAHVVPLLATQHEMCQAWVIGLKQYTSKQLSPGGGTWGANLTDVLGNSEMVHKLNTKRLHMALLSCV